MTQISIFMYNIFWKRGNIDNLFPSRKISYTRSLFWYLGTDIAWDSNNTFVNENTVQTSSKLGELHNHTVEICLVKSHRPYQGPGSKRLCQRNLHQIIEILLAQIFSSIKRESCLHHRDFVKVKWIRNMNGSYIGSSFINDKAPKKYVIML